MILGALAAIGMMTACTSENKNELHVKCNLEGVGDTLNVSIGNERDTTIVGKAGKFDFTLPISEATGLVAYASSINNMDNHNYFVMTAVPGETVEISGSLPNDYKIGGSRFYQNLAVIESEAKEAQKEMNDFITGLIASYEKGENEDSLNALYESQFETLQKAAEEKIMDIVKRNAQNEAATTLISSFSDVETMRKAYDLLSDEVKNGRLKDFALKPITELEERMEREE